MVGLVVSIVTVLLCSAGFSVGAAEQRPGILILGDSLSAAYGISVEASWPSLLEQRLSELGYRHSVINASISGETTAGGARRIDALLTRHQPAVVIVALGANDGLRGIAINETQKNVSDMIDRAMHKKVTPMLLKVRIPPNYGPRYTSAFEDIFDQLGARPEVVYAPFMLQQFATDQSAFLDDGLHPTAAVQSQILDTLWPSIETALAGLDDEALVH